MKKDGTPTRREVELSYARIAGYHDDSYAMTRALVERQTASEKAIREAFQIGQRMKTNGVKCACPNCK